VGAFARINHSGANSCSLLTPQYQRRWAKFLTPSHVATNVLSLIPVEAGNGLLLLMLLLPCNDGVDEWLQVDLWHGNAAEARQMPRKDCLGLLKEGDVMAWGQQGSNLYRRHLTLAWCCNRCQSEACERLTSGRHTIGLNDGEDGLEIISESNPPRICQKQGRILVWEGDNAPGPDHSRVCVAVVERAHCGSLEVGSEKPTNSPHIRHRGAGHEVEGLPQLNEVTLGSNHLPLECEHFGVSSGMLHNAHCMLLLEWQEEWGETTVPQDKECNREVLICGSCDELPDRNWGWVAITRGDVERCQEGIIRPAYQEHVANHVVEQAGERGMTVCHT
jgi:hypothetical protein